MRKISLLFFATLLLLSCSDYKFSAKINGNITGASKEELVVKVLEFNSQKILDTVKTNNRGDFSYRVKRKNDEANFYYLYFKNRKIASLFIQNGDRIEFIADTLGELLSIKGSKESELLYNVESQLINSKIVFDSLTNELLNITDKERTEEFNYALGATYVKQKQQAIRHIYSNPNSITNLILLYHKFTDKLPLFADSKDMLFFRRVYDSLSRHYPNLVYVKKIKEEITAYERMEALQSKLIDADEKGFPDLNLPNNRSENMRLSDLTGRVILLSFWSHKDANQRVLNREYLELYNRHSSKGFEIYQVSLDTDKTAWSRAVSDQQLPWISVCDGLGANSHAAKSYNVQELPANFLIDREGTIVVKDLYESDLEKRVIQLLK